MPLTFPTVITIAFYELDTQALHLKQSADSNRNKNIVVSPLTNGLNHFEINAMDSSEFGDVLVFQSL